MGYQNMLNLAAAVGQYRKQLEDEEQARVQEEWQYLQEQRNAANAAQAAAELDAANEKKNWYDDALNGASAGLSSGGWVGAIIGGIAGTTKGWIEATEQRKKEGLSGGEAFIDTFSDTPFGNLGKGIRTGVQNGFGKSQWASSSWHPSTGYALLGAAGGVTNMVKQGMAKKDASGASGNYSADTTLQAPTYGSGTSAGGFGNMAGSLTSNSSGGSGSGTMAGAYTSGYDSLTNPSGSFGGSYGSRYGDTAHGSYDYSDMAEALIDPRRKGRV